MNVHEYQAAEILARYGVPVNPGKVAETADEAAAIAARFIGIDTGFIRKALDRNRPEVTAIRNAHAVEEILGLMRRLGYMNAQPGDIFEFGFLEQALVR